jgi:hypothetical protein
MWLVHNACTLQLFAYWPAHSTLGTVSRHRYANHVRRLNGRSRGAAFVDEDAGKLAALHTGITMIAYENSVVVVTGAARGIGRAIATGLADAGSEVRQAIARGPAAHTGADQQCRHFSRKPTGRPQHHRRLAALLQFTRSLAVELGRNGIRANAVGPGIVRTRG